ncbi:hypothetical protein ABIC65_001082 [Sphingomonas trueperi]|uniref:DUF2213 domain-containing protein n=1 Tax=Sphingomonas trueperi TaxID=53317 RepID=UPI0033923273
MFYDRAQIAGSARITKDGYFVADALVARANNIQDYLAGELGLADRDPRDVVRVFRPADEVFHKDALASLAHRPVTLDHPSVPVQASNWKSFAVGDVGDEIMRDGEFVRVPIKIMDSGAIDSIKSDRREFSLGYTAEMVAQAGVHDGQSYDFVAKNFRYNHLAAVSRARGGQELRIVDERPQEKPKMKITIGDAKDVDLSDGAAVALAVGALNTSLADAQTKVGALTADLSTAQTALQTKDGEITALKQQLEDAKVTPEKLQQMADARADVIGKAKALDPKVVTDGKTDAEIRKAAVLAKLGDKAANMTDAAIEGAFAALTADAKPAQQGVTPIPAPVVANDHQAAFEDAHNKRLARYATAYKNTPAVAS